MRIAVLWLLLLVCNCRDQRPPQPTQEQSAQLNDAENMLNQADNSAAPAR